MSGVISTPTNSAVHANAALFALSSPRGASSANVNTATLHAPVSSAAFSNSATRPNITPVFNNTVARNNGAISAPSLPATSVVKANTPSTGNSYSLSQGALNLSGMINSNTAPDTRSQRDSRSDIGAIFSRGATVSEAGKSSGIGETAQRSSIFSDENASESPANAAVVEPDKQAEKQSAYSPFEQQNDQQQKAQELAEQAQLEQLSKRDAEVRAHEQAHANVGGNFARSPSLTYEQGSDGKRYAVDGEVSIDISAVPNDPLATLNKMKQVYAAAMAPVNPSMADIRVASEALRKMNEAKSQLAAERVEQAPSLQEINPLIDAGNAIKGIVIPDPIISQVFGKVNENGVISGKRVDSPSAIDNDRGPSQTIERLSRYILANDASKASSYRRGYPVYQSKVIDSQYGNINNEKRSSQLDFSV
ncbi:hypothetical protein K0I73_08725 [Shewanella mesophila]|uniref:putative metalloprotease CJM1_0395 family protein n=1 Tax=Shewanella mesophila TaxID=2864208 RepID=UPI001C6552C1|nr:putative metalloprotease CJM1_0395 family protein [Shewanella mesophila]QYJ87743.1 hypothetical protein K0I73_08725 [Shewanella mesophila]